VWGIRAPGLQGDELGEIDRKAMRPLMTSVLTDFESVLCTARQRAPEPAKGGESMSFKDLVHYLRARYAVEEGQTMAEYGVVLAVIAIGVVVALGLLSTSISGALDSVRSSL
jgi:Flp pilus assembly pilin Flp